MNVIIAPVTFDEPGARMNQVNFPPVCHLTCATWPEDIAERTCTCPTPRPHGGHFVSSVSKLITNCNVCEMVQTPNNSDACFSDRVLSWTKKVIGFISKITMTLLTWLHPLRRVSQSGCEGADREKTSVVFLQFVE